jgi:transposase
LLEAGVTVDMQNAREASEMRCRTLGLAVCRRLMTVPGVGPVASLSFKVGVDDPLRFTRSRTVGHILA